MLIVIDPAHTGESDPGLVAGDVREADIVLRVAQAAKDCLARTPGLTVRLTRESNADPVRPWSRPADAAARARTAVGGGADAVLSIHAHPDGLEVRHSNGALGLAQALHRRLGPLVARHRGIAPAETPPVPGVRCQAVYLDLGIFPASQGGSINAGAWDTWIAQAADAIATAIREAYALPAPVSTPAGAVEETATAGERESEGRATRRERVRARR